MLNLVLSCVYRLCSWVIPVIPMFLSPKPRDVPQPHPHVLVTDHTSSTSLSRLSSGVLRHDSMAWVWVCFIIILKYVEYGVLRIVYLKLSDDVSNNSYSIYSRMTITG